MQTNMTEKDKKLLVGMLIGVIIVAIGYWGIIPQLKKYGELETKIEKEEETQKINKMKAANVSMIEMQADDYVEKIEEVKDEFYQPMNSSEVDQMLTEMATKRRLSIYDLRFNMPSIPTSRMAYLNSALFREQQALMLEYEKAERDKEDDEETDEKDSDKSDKDDKSSDKKESSRSAGKTSKDIMNEAMGAEEGGYQPNTDIFAVPITISVGGEVSDLEQFLRDLHGLEKRALVTGFNWSEYREYQKRDASRIVPGDDGVTDTSVADDGTGVTAEQLEVDTKVKKTLTVRIEVYMCDTASAIVNTGESQENLNDEEVDEAEAQDEEIRQLAGE